ncbi:MAG: hypothetical protein KAW86_00060, partial [Bacteroidales bacterium]|nr:hypothetical protein [Bacteroidales bacterium]
MGFVSETSAAALKINNLAVCFINESNSSYSPLISLLFVFAASNVKPFLKYIEFSARNLLAFSINF